MRHIKYFKQLNEGHLNEDQFTRVAHTDEQEESISTVVEWLKQMGKTPSKALSMPEVPMAWNPPILIDVNYQGSEITIGWEGQIKIGSEEVDNFEDFKEALEAYMG